MTSLTNLYYMVVTITLAGTPWVNLLSKNAQKDVRMITVSYVYMTFCYMTTSLAMINIYFIDFVRSHSSPHCLSYSTQVIEYIFLNTNFDVAHETSLRYVRNLLFIAVKTRNMTSLSVGCSAFNQIVTSPMTSLPISAIAKKQDAIHVKLCETQQSIVARVYTSIKHRCSNLGGMSTQSEHIWSHSLNSLITSKSAHSKLCIQYSSTCHGSTILITKASEQMTLSHQPIGY